MEDDRIRYTASQYSPHIEYWTEKIGLPSDRYQFKIVKHRSDNAVPMQSDHFTLDKAQMETVMNLSGGRSLELYIILSAAWYILMARYGREKVIVLDSPLYLEQPSQTKFQSRIPLIQNIGSEDTIKELIMKTNDTVSRGYSYQCYPLDMILKKEGIDPAVIETNVFFSFQDIHPSDSNPEGYDLAIHTQRLEKAGAVGFSIQFNPDLYPPALIRNMTGHYTNIISCFKHLDTRFRDIRMLSETETETVLHRFNDNAALYPRDKSVVDVFEQQVTQNPENPALVFETHQMTYRQVNQQANQMANYLKNVFSVKPGDFVAIILERCEWTIISMLGIIKAGAVFLPIEPDSPADRIKHMLDDTDTDVVVTSHQLSAADRILRPQSFILFIEDLEEQIHMQPMTNPGVPVAPTDLIYIMYTSGSTGKPKGVLIEHRSVLRLVKNTNFVRIYKTDHMAQISNYAFDASTFEIWGALLNGASLHLLPEDAVLEAAKVKQFIRENAVTTMWLTTSLFNQLSEADIEIFTGVRNLLVGGEKLSARHINEVKKKYPELTIINGYGPTENTTFTACHRIEKMYPDDIPIGHPIANTHVLILDRYNQPMPVGVPGEICTGGDGLARGYLNDPDLTDKKFVPHPLENGKRLYRTGDLGYWTPEGLLCYMGRNDDQVKVRGFRIEIGEIEAKLLIHPSITQACVIAIQPKTGSKELAAYFVAEKELIVSDIRDYLAGMLPDYMIPSFFIRMGSLPLNQNGKIDKHALPDPVESGSGSGSAYLAPRNELEARLVEIWQEVLNRKQIGVNDNYFGLGGDSIKAIQLVSQLCRDGLTAEVRHIFQYPTVAELAGVIQPATREIDQMPVTGIVPLTPIQHWFFENHKNARHHFNQSEMIHSRNRINEKALQVVLHKIQEHHDALRMKYRFVETDTGVDIIQENADTDYPLSLEVVDLKDDRSAIETLASHAQDTQAGIDLKDGPMMKTVLYQLPDSDRLLIVIHHLTIDGVSWRILLEDLYTGYDQYIRGLPIQFPQKTDSFKRWAQWLYKYSTSETLLAEIPHWKTVTSTSTASTIDLNGEEVVSKNDPTACMKDTMTLEFILPQKKTTQLLTETNPAFNTEINDILLTALSRTISAAAGHRNAVISLEGHGRESVSIQKGQSDLQQPNITRTIGWFTSMFPVRLSLPESDDIGYQIKSIKESLRKIPNRGIGYGILKYLTPDELTTELPFKCRPEIGFNYLGQFDTAHDLSFKPASESRGDELSKNTEVVHPVDINGMVASGTLKIFITFNRNRYKTSIIRSFGQQFIDELNEIIMYCRNVKEAELTPSDIDYDGLTIDELDQVLNSL